MAKIERRDCHKCGLPVEWVQGGIKLYLVESVPWFRVIGPNGMVLGRAEHTEDRCVAPIEVQANRPVVDDSDIFGGD